MNRKSLSALAVAVAATFAAGAVHAGPVIIDGTDANDHGSVSGGVNQSGWKYMQRALENLGNSVTTSAAKVVNVIGTSAGLGLAGTSIASAFGLSSLASNGWTIQYHDGAAAITTFLTNMNTANTGILYMTTGNLSGGDMDSGEMAAVNAMASQINTFVGGAGNPSQGGALFAMGQSGANAFGWLQTLIPGITSTDAGGGGIGSDITLTAAGAAAFPGLTNGDLAGADPWHSYFSGNLGGLSVLGTALQNGVTRSVIIGGGAGTVLQCGDPGQPACPTIPEPGTLPLVGLAGLGLALLGARRRKAA